ncbi:cadherin-like beta sandwich domain-containing protein [Cohnella cellulosilytica]|uniref:non-reducing end alpha-L-arabinofuranosidase n=2 Tax=Cohnella cellulosilytica TaxID=986710 RepID=A0ABW2FDP2_9BACL
MFVTGQQPAYAAASAAEVTVNANITTNEVSQLLVGGFAEDLNLAMDGGFYAEKVFNRSFEFGSEDAAPYNTPLAGWTKVSRGGGSGTAAVENMNPLNAVNTHYLHVNVSAAGDGVGISNAGWYGVSVEAGAVYNYSFYARRGADFSSSLTLAIESTDGTSYGHATIASLTGEWVKYEGTLTSGASDADARLVLLANGTGNVYLDFISLFPAETYKNRPNGLRADIGEALEDMHLGFLRFPGGCIIHMPSYQYNWKDQLGPIETRKEYPNPQWNSMDPREHMTNGFGMFEWLQLSEDIGVVAVPVLPVGVKHIGSALSPDSAAMDQLVQDTLDFVEFANGSPTSTWGAKRAAMGHPEPFGLEYLALGNEEHDSANARADITRIYDAVHQAYPSLKLIVTASDSHSMYEFSQQLGAYETDGHYYYDRGSLDWIHFIYNYDRTYPKVMIGEYGSNQRDASINDALDMAKDKAVFEKNGDILDMSSFTLLRRVIDFDNAHVFKSNYYHVDKMWAENLADYNVNFRQSGDTSLVVVAGKDNETGDLILKLINNGANTINPKITLNGMTGISPTADVTYLKPKAAGNKEAKDNNYRLDGKGQSTDLNEVDYGTTTASVTGNQLDYSVEPYSFSIVRVHGDISTSDASTLHEAEILNGGATIASGRALTAEKELLTTLNASNSVWSKADLKAAGEFVRYNNFNVAEAGIYNVKVGYKSGSSRAILQMSIDGIAQGSPFDQYAAGQNFMEVDLGTATLSAGKHPVQFTATGKHASSSGYMAAIDYILLTPLPSAPEWQTVETGSTQVKLDWSPVPNAAGYVLQYGTESGVYAETVDCGNTTSYIVNGLTNDTEYYFVVRTKYADEEQSEASEERTAAPSADKLLAPQLVSVAPGNGKLTAQWTPVAGADHYRIAYGTASGQYSETVDNITGTSSEIEPLRDWTRYYLVVTAVNGSVESDPSNEGNAMVESAGLPSGDASLSQLAVSSGTLLPAFSPEIRSYTVSVADSEASVDLTPTAASSAYRSITVNGAPAVSGAASSVGLAAGDNRIPVVVQAQDGTVATYTIKIRKEAGSGGSTGMIPVDDPNIRYVGRWDKSDSAKYGSHWGGAYLKTRFTGTTASIHLGKTADILVNIDETGDKLLSGVNGTVNLTQVPLEAGTHSLRVAARYADDELVFQGLVLDYGATTVEPQIPANPVVEFIGDSIAAGMGNANGSGDSYAWLASDILGNEHTQITYPNLSLVDGTSSGGTAGMEEAYWKMKTPASAASADWDVHASAPQAIVVDLGSYDRYNGGDPAEFQSHYIQFLASLRDKYPNAEIFALRLFNGWLETEVSNAVQARIEAGDTKVRFVDTTGWLDGYGTPGSGDYQSDGMSFLPTRSGQAKAANKLAAVLKPYLALPYIQLWVEAEEMTLSKYTVKGNDYASMQKLIEVASGTGSASYVFDQPSGVYDVQVNYFDENDGTSSYKLYVDDKLIDSWTADRNLSSDAPDLDSLTRRLIANVDIPANSTVRIEGTASNGEQARTDKVKFFSPLDGASLSDLSISQGTLTPIFSPVIKDYSAIVANVVSRMDITPTATVLGYEALTVNGEPAVSGAASSVNLENGENRIPVVVKALDGATATYMLVITREAAQSGIASLSGLTLSQGALTPAFTPENRDYAVLVANDVSTLDITATATSPTYRSLTVNGESLMSGAAGRVHLAVGANAIPVVVTAQDGTTAVYTIVVTRDADHSRDNFNTMPAGSAPVGWGVNTSVGTVTVQDVPSAADKSVLINKVGTATGSKTSLYKEFAPLSGTVVIEAKVRRESTGNLWCLPYVYGSDGTTMAATIQFDNGNIKAYSNGGWQTLQPFAANTWYELKLVIDTDTDKFDFYVDGVQKVTQGALRNAVSDIGKIEFYAADFNAGTTYVDIEREPYSIGDAALRALEISSGTLSPAFAPNEMNYEASVANRVTSIGITPTVSASVYQSLTVNGVPAASGTETRVELVEGINDIPIVVISEDGTAATYKISVTRADEPDPGEGTDPVDKTALQIEANADSGKQEADYTSETWGPFAAALTAAHAVLAASDATQTQVDQALQRLQETREALKEVPPRAVSGSFAEGTNIVTVAFDRGVAFNGGASPSGFTVTVDEQAATVTAAVYETDPSTVILALPDDIRLSVDANIRIDYDGAGRLVGTGDQGSPVGRFTLMAENPFAAALRIVGPSGNTTNARPAIYGGVHPDADALTVAVKDAKGNAVGVNGKLNWSPGDAAWSYDLNQTLAPGAYTVEATARDGERTVMKTRSFAVQRVSSPGGGGSVPSESTETLAVDVVSGDDDQADMAQVEIKRTTGSDGRIHDEVVYTRDKARETVDKALAGGKRAARIVIPDDRDAVSEVNLEIPQETAALLRENGIDLEFFNPNVWIQVPNGSLGELENSVYFKLVPVKDVGERNELEARARAEDVVRQWAEDELIDVVARPMKVETNLTNRPVTLTLPLRGVALPEKESELAAYLAQLGIFIEHSNGEREVAAGLLVTMPDGQPGLQFSIAQFSTFAIIDFNRAIALNPEQGRHEAYVGGFPDGLFKPLENVTREQFAAMIARNLGYTEGVWSGEAPFADVSKTSWSAGAIAFVKEKGLMQGRPDGSFKPNEAVTRAEIATVIANYRDLAVEKGGTLGFNDIAGHWAQGSIRAALEAGLINGYADGSFKPGRSATRAEAVAMLNRMFGRGPLNGVEQPSFPDVPADFWAFKDIEEAAAAHFYIIDDKRQEVISR